MCAGDLSADGGGSVGIITKICCSQNGVSVIVCVVKALEDCFQAINHIAGAADLLLLFLPVGVPVYAFDLWRKLVQVDVCKEYYFFR